MSKKKLFNLRIDNATFEFFKDNLPPEVESVAELLRVGGMQFIKGSLDDENSVSIDITRIAELVAESEGRITFGIEQNRSILVAIQSSLINEGIINESKMKKSLMIELVDYWLKDPIKLVSIKKLDELELHFPFPHLSNAVYDAIQYLTDQKMLLVSPGGKLNWKLE